MAVEHLFILGGNPRRKHRRPAARRLLHRARRNPAVGAGDPIPAILRKGMKPIRDKQARRRSKRGGLRAGSPEALAWGRKMKRARYRKAHPAVKRTKKVRSVARKSTRKGVRHMAKRRKHTGGMRKGSPKAKAWGRKMKRLRAAKSSKRRTKRTYTKRTTKRTKRVGKKVRHYRRRTKLRRLLVPAAWGKGYKRRGYKRIRVMSNPTNKLFSWLKFGAWVLAGFAGATAINKLLNTYVFKNSPVSPMLSGLGVAAVAILFGKKIWRQMPESFVTGLVANAMLSTVVVYAPKDWLEWVIPGGIASQAALEAPPAGGDARAYIPGSQALQDYGNPYNSYGGDSNPLTASPFAGGIY